MTEPVAVSIRLDGAEVLPGLWQDAPQARACLVLAHGAGAGMHHRAMTSLADGLAARQISTLRFDFPFVARGSKRPDPPAVAQSAVRVAVAEARTRTDLPLFAGGRSFGGRMTSRAQAEMSLPGICGLVFFASPLHSADKPSTDRTDHLADVQVPMLSFEAHGVPWPRSTCCAWSSTGSAPALGPSWRTKPTTRSTCRHGAGAARPRPSPTCCTPVPPGWSSDLPHEPRRVAKIVRAKTERGTGDHLEHR